MKLNTNHAALVSMFTYTFLTAIALLIILLGFSPKLTAVPSSGVTTPSLFAFFILIILGAITGLLFAFIINFFLTIKFNVKHAAFVGMITIAFWGIVGIITKYPLPTTPPTLIEILYGIALVSILGAGTGWLFASVINLFCKEK